MPDALPKERPLVVVADDDTEIACLVELVLEREGFGVVKAMHGNEALDLIRTYRPDAVVLDIMMPGVNGYQVLEKLRGEDATRTLPVILLSARAGALDRKYGMRLGADDYILKPFKAEDLLVRLRAVLGVPAPLAAVPSPAA